MDINSVINSKLDGRHKYLLLMYSHVADNDGIVHGITDEAMVEIMGISRSSIFRYRNKLIEMGVLEPLPGVGNYQINCVNLTQNEKCQIDTYSKEKCQSDTKQKSVNLTQNSKNGQQHNVEHKEIYIYNLDQEDQSIHLTENSNEQKNIEKLRQACPPPKFLAENGRKRKKTQRDITLQQLEDFFVETTRLPPPLRDTEKQKRASAEAWWNPLWQEIYVRLSSRDVDIAKRLILDTVKQMREDKLTIASPRSIIKVAADIKAKWIQDQESADYWTNATGGGAF